MKLTFRSQFILAPVVIIITLSGLVSYILIELRNINYANEILRRKAVIFDRTAATLSGVTRLTQLIDKLPPVLNKQTTNNSPDVYFNYLEQTQIVANGLLDPYLRGQLPSALGKLINQLEPLLRQPETVTPTVINKALKEIVPALELQINIFAAQKRTALIDNHRQLTHFSSRMTSVLLTVLILCILLAIALSTWGLYVMRKRLNSLVARSAALYRINKSVKSRDEIDNLEHSLANATSQLVNGASVENLLRGAENERRRIARDMHDGLLADLTGINRRLDALNQNPELPELLDVRANVDEVIVNLRRAIDDLHPQVLEILGLEAALRSYLSRHGAVAGFPEYHFEFESQIDKRLVIEQKLNLFRIISEAINNVVKHARASRLEVCLRVLDALLLVSVEDNGVGFTTNPNSSGHGCANIRERARLLGATIEWRASRFSSGTCFELILPLPKQE